VLRERKDELLTSFVAGTPSQLAEFDEEPLSFKPAITADISGDFTPAASINF
jgi:hypothetical protein